MLPQWPSTRATNDQALESTVPLNPAFHKAACLTTAGEPERLWVFQRS